ncbi:hypothetical protein CEXT_565401 [Caerostris extrusa]|uniref:Uncharacterized protein n=1 Tax=Caerostris extrusa TaxID=172846 RepID=A0AAV4VP28_CAEEX|nr:hypothetical protein CEXT_565401 [Caerostris extrusa]
MLQKQYAIFQIEASTKIFRNFVLGNQANDFPPIGISPTKSHSLCKILSSVEFNFNFGITYKRRRKKEDREQSHKKQLWSTIVSKRKKEVLLMSSSRVKRYHQTAVDLLNIAVCE